MTKNFLSLISLVIALATVLVLCAGCVKTPSGNTGSDGNESDGTESDGAEKQLTSNGFELNALIDNDESLKKYSAPRLTNDVIIGRKDSWLFWKGESSNSLDDFMGTNLYLATEKAEIADKIKTLDELLKSIGKTFVFTICPNKEQIYGEYMPSYNIVSEESRVEGLMDFLQKNTDVICVYDEAPLFEYKKTYQLYCKLDTHWTSAGAYLWASEILSALNLPTVDLYEVGLKKITRAVPGDLAEIAKLPTTPDTDYEIDFLPGVTVTTELSYQRNNRQGEEYRTLITTSDSENTQKLAIIGDSFRSAMNPVFFKSFAKVSSYHFREIHDTKIYMMGDAANEDFIANLCEADVIMLESVERSFNSFYLNHNFIIDNLISLFTQYKADLQAK